MTDSQQLSTPRFVKYHDGAGKAFAFLVTKEDEGEHLSGAVWCDDLDNHAGLSDGWNPRVQIGRSNDAAEIPSGGAWSPFDNDEKE